MSPQPQPQKDYPEYKRSSLFFYSFSDKEKKQLYSASCQFVGEDSFVVAAKLLIPNDEEEKTSSYQNHQGSIL